MSDDLTIDKPAFLRERGWSTWYNENYWVHPRFGGQGRDHTNWGLGTDEAYAYETNPESKEQTLKGMALYAGVQKALSNLGFQRSEYTDNK